MALDVIRSKLDWNSPNRYTTLEQLVRDARLMFKNAYTYNAVSLKYRLTPVSILNRVSFSLTVLFITMQLCWKSSLMSNLKNGFQNTHMRLLMMTLSNLPPRNIGELYVTDRLLKVIMIPPIFHYKCTKLLRCLEFMYKFLLYCFLYLILCSILVSKYVHTGGKLNIIIIRVENVII